MDTNFTQEYQQCVSIGLKLYTNKEYKQALLNYQRGLQFATKINQNHYLHLVSLIGLNYSAQSQYLKALQQYNLVLEKEPLNTVTLIRRAEAYLKLNKYNQVLIDLNKGLQLEPDNVKAPILMQQLEQKLNQLKQSEKLKYSLKKKVSEILYREDQELFLNFSNLKQIDKKVSTKQKAVMFNKVQQVHEIDHQNQQIIQKPQLDTQTIKLIQKQQQIQLNPMILHKQISQQSQVKLVFKRLDSKSILRQTKKISESEQNTPIKKRISVLSVKDIDGKVIQRSDKKSKEKQLTFGFVDNIQKQDQIISHTLPLLKKKSSLKNKSKFYFENSPTKSGFSNVNIEGKVLHSDYKQDTQVVLQDLTLKSPSISISNSNKFQRKDSILKKPGELRAKNLTVMFSS